MTSQSPQKSHWKQKKSNNEKKVHIVIILYLHHNCRVSSVQECWDQALTQCEKREKHEQWKVTSEHVARANMQEPQTVTSAPFGHKVQVMHREEQKT